MFDSDRRHLIAYLAAAAVLVVIAVRYVDRASGSNAAPAVSMPAPAPAHAARARARPRPAAKVDLIWVDIAGAVRRPGLYSLPKDARVAAGIQGAGGFARHANRAGVNLAAKLADGQQVFVPRRGPGGEVPAAATGNPAGAGPGATGAPVGGAGAGGPLSLSSASQAELEQLDGVGPALAQRIIEYRRQHGGFQSIDELQEVSGIGPKRFAALKSAIAP